MLQPEVIDLAISRHFPLFKPCFIFLSRSSNSWD